MERCGKADSFLPSNGDSGACDFMGDFFDAPCCIDCRVEEHCASLGADGVLRAAGVHEKKLVDMGEGWVDIGTCSGRERVKRRRFPGFSPTIGYP